MINEMIINAQYAWLQKKKKKEKHYTWLQNNKNKNNIHGCKKSKSKTL